MYGILPIHIHTYTTTRHIRYTIHTRTELEHNKKRKWTELNESAEKKKLGKIPLRIDFFLGHCSVHSCRVLSAWFTAFGDSFQTLFHRKYSLKAANNKNNNKIYNFLDNYLFFFVVTVFALIVWKIDFDLLSLNFPLHRIKCHPIPRNVNKRARRTRKRNAPRRLPR